MTLRKGFVASSLLAATALGGSPVLAESSVAITSVQVPAQTDTRVSLPVTRQAVGSFEIAANGITGNTVTLDGAGFAGGDFPANSQGSPLFYARFTSGELEGRWFNIVGQSGDALDLNIEDTASPADLSAAGEGDTLAIYPHWTVDTIFPAGLEGLSFTASPSPFNQQFRVLIPRDSDGVGTDTPVSTILFYVSGSWFNTFGAPAGSTVVAPQGTLTLRNTNPVSTGNPDDPGTLVDESSGDLTFIAAGGRESMRVVERIPVESAQNDTVVGVNNIETVTLGESGLGAVIDNSPNPFNRTDLLVVAPSPDAGAGFDVPASDVFFRFGGAFFNTGGVSADDFELKPGQVVIIRKEAGTPGSLDLVTND